MYDKIHYKKKNLKKKEIETCYAFTANIILMQKKKKDGNLTVSVLTTKPKNKAKATQGSFQG